MDPYHGNVSHIVVIAARIKANKAVAIPTERISGYLIIDHK
jgi:hypothetical protein